MFRADKILLTMGSAMLISSGAAMAGPPGGASFGDFTASNGTITATCPTAAAGACGTAITGDGFFQRSLVISGVTYYQTIVLPTGANVNASNPISALEFADENFVQQGGGTGIADQQNVFAAGTTNNPGNFTSSTAINSGWAQDGGSVVVLSQTLSDTSVGFNAGFSLNSDGTTATGLTLTQTVNLDSNGTSNGDTQVFDLRQLTATAAGNTTAGSELPDGSTIAWVAGDIIQAVWMGQQVTASGQQLSGFLGYSVNHGGSTTAISYTDQTVTGPNFGTKVYDPAFTDGGSNPAPTF